MPSTANYAWPTPADSDLVKDGAAAIRALGNAADSTLSSRRLARSQHTSQQTPITTETDLTGLSITFDAPTGHRVRVEGRVNFTFNSTAGDQAQLRLTDGSNNSLDMAAAALPFSGSTGSIKLRVTWEFVGDGESHTYKLRAIGSGAGGVAAANAANRVAAIEAFDDGVEPV